MGLPVRWEDCPDWNVAEPVVPKPIRNRRRVRPLQKLAIGMGMLVVPGILGLAAVGARDLMHITTPASALALAASSAGTAKVQLASATADRRLGFITVTGNAANATGNSIKDVEAVVELLNRQGQTIRQESALVTYGSLSSRSNSPFSVVLDDDPQAVAYRVQFKQLLGSGLN